MSQRTQWHIGEELTSEEDREVRTHIVYTQEGLVKLFTSMHDNHPKTIIGFIRKIVDHVLCNTTVLL